MKNKSNIRPFLCGVLCTVLVVGLAAPTLAATASKSITVSTGANIYVDDVKLNPTDANGNPVEVFIYGGTTYLPVRAVGQALGKNVSWDGSTSSVFIGNHATANKSAVSLDKLEYFTSTGSLLTETLSEKDNLGNSHDTAHFYPQWMTEQGSITYIINGKYSKLTGTYFLPYDERSTTYSYIAKIYGDGNQIWSGTVTGGVEPIGFDIDLTGVNELKFEFATSGEYFLRFDAYFGDTMFFI